MSDSLTKHIVALCATIVCGLAYYSGWVSGKNGWWWTVFALFIIYGGVYKIIRK